ncbi:MAG: hypothetical protein JXB47_15650 [Anaerolineae bacterium]|nr:hypothetical protein [Anaerolineae bacterium]
MKGRYWIGILGAIVGFFVGLVTGFVFPPFCGLAGLAVTTVGGAVAGFMVTQVDDDVKANPDEATNAGAIAGLLTGIGAGIGQIAAALALSWLFTGAPEGVWDQQLFEQMMQDAGYGDIGIETEDLLGLVSGIVVFAGVCYGVVGLALTTGAGALAARYSKPARPSTAEASSLPDWGRTPEEPPGPPDDAGEG